MVEAGYGSMPNVAGENTGSKLRSAKSRRISTDKSGDTTTFEPHSSHPQPNRSPYSYLSASIGLIRDAFTAG